MRIGAGRLRNALLPDAGPDVRPVSGRLRQSLFTVLLARLDGARVLDLCAGVGGLGLEALSRGAASVVLVDRDRARVDALERWIVGRGEGRHARASIGDARRPSTSPDRYDLVFLDPPFAVWEGPDGPAFLATAVAALAPGGVVALKVPARATLPQDPRWRLLDRRAQGDAAWALVSASPPP